ncbi:MAG: hypothetical protein SFW67_27420 [Myxococcaceae bacterium]|nr:hypothetical protein [Myxococcaceae bacterium]
MAPSAARGPARSPGWRDARLELTTTPLRFTAEVVRFEPSFAHGQTKQETVGLRLDDGRVARRTAEAGGFPRQGAEHVT